MIIGGPRFRLVAAERILSSDEFAGNSAAVRGLAIAALRLGTTQRPWTKEQELQATGGDAARRFCTPAGFRRLRRTTRYA